ncbi:hypothetical protein GALLN_00060 [Gallionellaceae bacterium]|nr:hypothetical protein GALLN_00060 [Gallionellaceae bacterium]
MDTPDIMIYVHPELPAEGRAKVEKEVMGCNGVIAADFDHHKHPHALTVVYNPDAISGKQILAAVQKYDPAASMVGM